MAPIFGLVACGGKSLRMVSDKCLLEYHGMPQWKYIYNLLKPICDKVYISCNKSQVVYFREKVEFIEDAGQYSGTGPMAALLSAFERHQQISFLLIGCDYPYIKQEDLQLLLNVQDEKAKAVSLFNQSINSYEPLLTLYKPSCFKLLKQNFQNKQLSLRYFLEEVDAFKVNPSNVKSILSVDTMFDYENEKKRIIIDH